MKKVVSIALFGDGQKYSQYFYAFALGHLNLFPLRDRWFLRVHVDDVVAGGPVGESVRRLEREGLVEYRRMGSSRNLAGTLLLTKCMLWRCAPIFDDDAEYVFCRDLDAAPTPRDRAACEQFIMSKAAIHTIHDNLAHTGVMGGLSGFWAPEFRKQTGMRTLEDLYKFSGKTNEEWSQHGTDQQVLNKLTQNPRVTLLEHRFDGWTEGNPDNSKARSASTYECQSWSAAMPDRGWSPPGWARELTERADRLANHLGAAGYDHVTARKFWEQHGDQEIARLIKECE